MASKNEAIRLLDVPRVCAWIGPRRNGAMVDYTTVYRWAREGIQGVKLRTLLHGGLLYTTERDVRAFFAEVAAKRDERLKSKQMEEAWG